MTGISDLTPVGSDLSFIGTTATQGQEVWKLNNNVVSLVSDLNPGASGSNPNQLTAVGSLLTFVATDGKVGPALWRYDGSQVQLVADIRSTAGIWGVPPSTGEIVKVDAASGVVTYSFAAPGSLLPTHTQIGLNMADQGTALLYVNSNDDAKKLYRLNPVTGAQALPV